MARKLLIHPAQFTSREGHWDDFMRGEQLCDIKDTFWLLKTVLSG